METGLKSERIQRSKEERPWLLFGSLFAILYSRGDRASCTVPVRIIGFPGSVVSKLAEISLGRRGRFKVTTIFIFSKISTYLENNCLFILRAIRINSEQRSRVFCFVLFFFSTSPTEKSLLSLLVPSMLFCVNHPINYPLFVHSFSRSSIGKRKHASRRKSSRLSFHRFAFTCACFSLSKFAHLGRLTLFATMQSYLCFYPRNTCYR